MFNEPIRHEYHLLKMPVLLIIGKSDRSVFFRRYASPDAIKPLGNWPALGRQALSRHMMPLSSPRTTHSTLCCADCFWSNRLPGYQPTDFLKTFSRRGASLLQP
jgi:hypothetical protein